MRSIKLIFMIIVMENVVRTGEREKWSLMGWVEWFFFFSFGILIMNNWGLLLIEITSENFALGGFDFWEYDNWNILLRKEIWVYNWWNSLASYCKLFVLPTATHHPSQFPEILINYTIYRIMHASQLTRTLQGMRQRKISWRQQCRWCGRRTEREKKS